MQHDAEQNQAVTRRTFLQMVGAVGGATAVYETMVAMGLINTPTAWAGPPKFAPGFGKDQRVLILGSGIGGLTAAYELMKGTQLTCEILEAQDRFGGRSLTARHGTKIVEQSPKHGRTTQISGLGSVIKNGVETDEPLYLNMGPGRIPYHHRRALHYCQALGVALEPYVMMTTANLYQTDRGLAGEAVTRRRLDADTRGYISELLSKAIRKDRLDQPLEADDVERLLDLLRAFGNLDERNHYQGSTRAGCRYPETVYDFCEPPVPIPLRGLLQTNFWRHSFYQPQDFLWQPTLFQPVGGMDKLVDGFIRALQHEFGDRVTIHLDSPANKISVSDDGVVVRYTDGKTGLPASAKADYCVSNIPLPVLKSIPADFSRDFQQAVNAGQFAPTCKVGWQSNARFWENDRYQIYGGISYIDHTVTQMWYPSNDYFTDNGTLTGLYNFRENAVEFGNLSLAQRLKVARQGALRLHPEFADEATVPQTLGLSIAWQNVPYQLGGWADWQADQQEEYARLLSPDQGRFFIVGDQVSSLPGWQEGAMMSAEHVLLQIAGLRSLEVKEVPTVPDVKRMVEGAY